MPAITESTAARAPTPTVKRDAKGKWLPGVSGHPGGDAARARKSLNAATIAELHKAFREGGAEAINTVMRQSPAIFLKLLVLLVPRELEVTRTGSLKQMSDEQLEAGIAAVEAMLAKRAESTIDVTPSPGAPETSETPFEGGTADST